MLRDVFHRFDIDKSGAVEASEIMELGRVSRPSFNLHQLSFVTRLSPDS